MLKSGQIGDVSIMAAALSGTMFRIFYFAQIVLREPVHRGQSSVFTSSRRRGSTLFPKNFSVAKHLNNTVEFEPPGIMDIVNIADRTFAPEFQTLKTHPFSAECAV